MTAVAERSLGGPPAPPASRWRGRLAVPPTPVLLSLGLASLNATLFMILRPGVNDLWAARARASAVSHGVGLTYWFAWFGGSTPGNYSVLTPYLSALLSAELVGALAAVSLTLLTAAAARGTAHPMAATAVATIVAGVNLWSGRIPFLLASALALAAVLAVLNHRPVVASLLSLVSISASPVSAAFLALALVGVFVSVPRYRVIAASTIATIVVGFGLDALAFGAPGPQSYSWVLCVEAIGALVLLLVARPPQFLRVAIWSSMFAAIAMVLVPNGMGANFGRWVLFCLPVVVVATSSWRTWIAAALVSPMVIAGANMTVIDLRDAGDPVATAAYYQPLARELDHVSGLGTYRLEVVAEGAHAAYDALLDHAMLARGWETQEDNALNATVMSRSLDAGSYKVWLDKNSVGYVAIPKSQAQTFPEYLLVASGRVPYLEQVWTSAHWVLYRVADPTPIVALPQRVLAYSQSRLTIRSSCACTFTVRIRYSKYLSADPLVPRGQPGPTKLSDDGYGYTSMTTLTPGDYVLHGSVVRLFH